MYQEKLTVQTVQQRFFFQLSCDFWRILCRNFVFHLYIENISNQKEEEKDIHVGLVCFILFPPLLIPSLAFFLFSFPLFSSVFLFPLPFFLLFLSSSSFSSSLWILSKLLHCWDRPEYWEESWILEETCCHSNSSEKSIANSGVKNSQRTNKLIIRSNLTTPFRASRIIKIVMETWWDLLSLRLLWKITSY